MKSIMNTYLNTALSMFFILYCYIAFVHKVCEYNKLLRTYVMDVLKCLSDI